MSKPEDDNDLFIESDSDFVDYCLDLAVRQGRIQKKGNLAHVESDDGTGKYIGDITYGLVLN